MPRSPRDNAPGLRHVIGQSVSARALFYDDHTRHTFMALLTGTFERYSMSVVAYCLLSTHYHLIVETTEPDLSRSLQWLNSRFAETINGEAGERGHLFGARFWSKRIETDEQLLGTVRYLARNPIEAGLCRSAEEWPWSSYTVLVLGMRRPPFLRPGVVLSLLGSGTTALRRLRAFVEDGVALS